MGLHYIIGSNLRVRVATVIGFGSDQSGSDPVVSDVVEPGCYRVGFVENQTQIGVTLDGGSCSD